MAQNLLNFVIQALKSPSKKSKFLKILLPYDPPCSFVGWLLGWLLLLTLFPLKGGKLHFHAPIGALVLIMHRMRLNSAFLSLWLLLRKKETQIFKSFISLFTFKITLYPCARCSLRFKGAAIAGCLCI